MNNRIPAKKVSVLFSLLVSAILLSEQIVWADPNRATLAPPSRTPPAGELEERSFIAIVAKTTLSSPTDAQSEERIAAWIVQMKHGKELIFLSQIQEDSIFALDGCVYYLQEARGAERPMRIYLRGGVPPIGSVQPVSSISRDILVKDHGPVPVCAEEISRQDYFQMEEVKKFTRNLNADSNVNRTDDFTRLAGMLGKKDLYLLLNHNLQAQRRSEIVPKEGRPKNLWTEYRELSKLMELVQKLSADARWTDRTKKLAIDLVGLYFWSEDDYSTLLREWKDQLVCDIRKRDPAAGERIAGRLTYVFAKCMDSGFSAYIKLRKEADATAQPPTKILPGITSNAEPFPAEGSPIAQINVEKMNAENTAKRDKLLIHTGNVIQEILLVLVLGPILMWLLISAGLGLFIFGSKSALFILKLLFDVSWLAALFDKIFEYVGNILFDPIYMTCMTYLMIAGVVVVLKIIDYVEGDIPKLKVYSSKRVENMTDRRNMILDAVEKGLILTNAPLQAAIHLAKAQALIVDETLTMKRRRAQALSAMQHEKTAAPVLPGMDTVIIQIESVETNP